MRRTPCLACSILFATACGTVVDDSDPEPDPAPGPDVPTGSARCDKTKPFGTPALVSNVNSTASETAFALTGDELTAFGTTDASLELAVAQRGTKTSPFGIPTRGMLAALNAEDGYEYEPSPTSDGLALYFVRYTPAGALQLFAALRDDLAAAFSFGLAVKVDGFLVTGIQKVAISRDDQTLYWVDANEAKLHAATLIDLHDNFAGARDASTMTMSDIVVSADELTLYYAVTGLDVMVATRASKTAPFDAGVPVVNVNSLEADAPVFVTADDCVLYLKSTRTGGVGDYDIWEARRPR